MKWPSFPKANKKYYKEVLKDLLLGRNVQYKANNDIGTKSK